MITRLIATGRNLHQVQDTVTIFRVRTNSMGVVHHAQKTLDKVIEHAGESVDKVCEAGEHPTEHNGVH